jgi:hypothetical protein
MPNEQKTGVIDAIYSTDTGGIKENSSNDQRDFYQEGASVDFIVGDSVSYRLITLPNGKPPIIADVKKN